MLRARTIRWVFLLVLLAGVNGAASEDAFKTFKLKTLDGDQKTLTDVLGSKATLVFFFFPTCKYCNQAAPAMQQIYDTYKDQGLSMVWINAVPQEEKLVAGWRARHGYTVPILVGASVRAVEKDYKVALTPTSYLLDARGNIVSTHAGYKPGDEKALEQEIRRALE